MSEGLIDKGLEKVGLKDYPMPSPEPETAQLLQIKPTQAKDRKGGTMEYYKIGAVTYDRYAFKAAYFSKNVEILKQKIDRCNGKIDLYKNEIAKIERFIKGQKSAFRSKEIRVIQAQEVVERLVQEYKEGLHKRFEVGDLEEIELKKSIERAKKNIPSLENESYIYRAEYKDIDDPKGGKKVFDDIRTLVNQYELQIAEIEKTELDPMEDRLEANEFWKKKALANHEEYQRYLNS